MLISLRRLAAAWLSLIVLVVSIGFVKPNFSGVSTVSDSSLSDHPQIALGLEGDD